MKGILSFLAATFLLVLGPTQVQATTWDVPNDRATIDLAIQAASNGDIILVTQNHDENAGFTVDKQLTITKNAGLTVTVNAGASDAYAITITADDSIVEGLIINAGSSPSGIVRINATSEVRDCTLQDNGNVVALGGADLYAGAQLSNCTMNLTSGQPKAVYISDSSSQDPARVVGNVFNISVTSAKTADQAINVAGGDYAVIDGNTVSFTGASASDAIGVWIQSGQDHCNVTDNTLTNASTAFIAVDNQGSYTTITGNVAEDFTYGVRIIQGGVISAENNTIVRGSCTSGSYGIWTGVGLQSATLDFSNNLIENMGTGFHFNTSVGGSWTISHNAYWTDSQSCGTGSNRTLTTD